jgi:hypothetical protein
LPEPLQQNEEFDSQLDSKSRFDPVSSPSRNRFQQGRKQGYGVVFAALATNA